MAVATVIEEFERQVQLSPDSLALVFEETELSFKQLNELANRFAHAMRLAGVQKGMSVGLCIDRRPEAIASMLGAFKIGAAFVPLDPEYPADRVRFMIEDADIHVVVTHGLQTNVLASRLHSLFGQASKEERKLCWIDSKEVEFGELSPSNASIPPSEDDLAYIMYTSGSTGVPKGVQIEHRALAVYCNADRKVYELTAGDRTLQFSTLNFDIAIEEIFPPLLCGGVVVIRPSSRSASNNELSSIIDQYRITAIHIATAYWHEWVDLMFAAKTPVPASLRLVIATGEKVSVAHYQRWKSLVRQPIKWCNAYGPTEATVSATVYIPTEDFDATQMPIGKPLAGYEAFILDDKHRPLEVGETGLLYIGGDALARGYHNDPAKTNAAFLTVALPGRGPTRIYRTGDLARWLPSGDIEFAGRVDHQIKIGSYRIEPGEIEAAIAKYPRVLESLVVHEEVAGQKFLVAYVAAGNDSIVVRDLHDFLRASLPVYMVPPRYVMLTTFPKTINGKIDRRSLPSAESSQPVRDEEFAAPQTEMQQKLAKIWQKVLHCPRIGIHDDFFALGGSSLLVTRIVAALATDFDITLPVRDFFASPTIAASAEHVSRLIAAKNGDLLLEEKSSLPPSQARTRLPILHTAMLPANKGSLFTVHYEPRIARRKHAVLMCNSIGHEQIRAYRNLQQLALLLAHKGFDVLRFDYRGTGNSTGHCEACNEISLVEDTRIAASYLRQQVNFARLSVIGIRLGATIATSALLEDIDQLILWDPVIEGRNFVTLVDQFHDRTLRSQTRFSVRVTRSKHDQAFGHQFGPLKRESLNRMRMANEPVNLCKRNRIITSHGYREHEKGFDSLSKNWIIDSVEDAIGWEQFDCSERAFSSPETYRAIVDCLTAGSDESLIQTQQALPWIACCTGATGELVS